MLTLILSKDLKLRFISPDATASFRPYPVHLDLPIEAAEGLMAVDPGLSLDCRPVLRSGPAVAREINPSGGAVICAGSCCERQVMGRPRS